MVCKRLVTVAVTSLTATAFAVLPADARAKKNTKYRADSATLSLDGRNTGRARTCGFDTFLYDGYGVPVGPYCH
jgi:hypothetical protein